MNVRSKKDSFKKKRNEQHRVDERGLQLLRSSLPDNTKMNIVFVEQTKNDYGLDGELQVFVNEYYTGEIFKAQLKSTSKPEHSSDGSYISYSLDLASAYLLAEDMKTATVLIIADTASDKVYWHPIQTDVKLKQALNDKLATEVTTKEPSIAVRISTMNELRPDNYQDMYAYLQTASLQLSQKAMIRTRTDKTLSAGMAALNEVQRGILDLPGFDWCYRNEHDPVPAGVMFSVTQAGGKIIDYTPNRDFRPELAPKIKFTAKFSKKSKSDREKFKTFRHAIENGTGPIELDAKNIVGLKAMVGKHSLDKSEVGRAYKVSIEPSKVRQTFLISNGYDELMHEVLVWLEGSSFRLESVPGQPLYLSASFSAQHPETTFHIRINNESLQNVSHELRMIEFVRSMKQAAMYILDTEGFRRKLFGGDVDGSKIISEDGYKFAKALSEIETKSGVPIPYPLPEEITREDVYDVYWLHRLLTENKIIKDVTMRFVLKSKPPEEPRKGGAVLMSQNPPEIYLFNKPYIIPGMKQTVKGVIDEMDVKKDRDGDHYKVRIKKAEFLIEKDQKI